jgi:hypothetical protein
LGKTECLEAACWVHARRPFFAMAGIEENARRKTTGRRAKVIVSHKCDPPLPFVRARAANPTTTRVGILRLQGPLVLCIKPLWGPPLGSAHSPL